MKKSNISRVIGYSLLLGLLLILTHALIQSPIGRNAKIAIMGAKKVDNINDVSLGMSMDIVRYTKGVADNYYYEDPNDPEFKKGWELVVSSNELGKDKFKDKTDRDFDEWSWDIEKPKVRLEVKFDANNKKVVRIRCYDDTKSGKCVVGDVVSGDTEEYAISLGKAPQKSIETGGQTLRIAHKDLDLILYLTQKKVYMIDIVKQ